jgi:hypothetical protein
MATQPFNKHNTATVVDGSDQAIVVRHDIKDHPISPDDMQGVKPASSTLKKTA